ncbi:GNAT family N-acetyltransferase [Pseudomonas syringae]|uniref:GNAT family N-acetyltransferase n=1 Tax=Pseudomonas syringae TaxID=317 RepID=UPI00076082AA|nr:GNAT family N-acetyltransferase [Pseudomonas syringae]KWS96045.1 acetyltransferase [Pseudomonas syringae pv. castaneae]
MLIRHFCEGDEAALFQVFSSAIREVASRDYTPVQIEAWAPKDPDWTAWNIRIRDINPFVAVLDDHIVGYADVQASGYIDHFFVSGFHARQGIGQQLMDRVVQEATDLKYIELTSHVSKTAESFFIRNGFEIVARRHSVSRGVELPNVLMRRRM